MVTLFRATVPLGWFNFRPIQELMEVGTVAAVIIIRFCDLWIFAHASQWNWRF